MFRLALSAAVREMAVAAGLLERRQTAEPTRMAQSFALARLGLLLESLKPEPALKKPGDSPGGAAGGKPESRGGQPPAGGNAAQALAELKLLKLMQEEIRLRTRALDDAVHRGGLRADDCAASTPN